MDVIEHELKTILTKGETLTVEFKSDAKGLSDRDLVAAVIAMASVGSERTLSRQGVSAYRPESRLCPASRIRAHPTGTAGKRCSETF